MHVYCEICYSIIDIYIAETTQSNHFKTYLNDYCTSFSDIWTEMWCFCLCECSRMWSGFRDLFCGRIVRRVKSYMFLSESARFGPPSHRHTQKSISPRGVSQVYHVPQVNLAQTDAVKNTQSAQWNTILPIIQSWNHSLTFCLNTELYSIRCLQRRTHVHFH